MSLLAVSCQKGVPRFFPYYYQLLPQQWKLLHNRSIIGVTWQLYHQKNSSVVKKVNKSLPKTEKRARLFRPKTTLIILGIVFLASGAAGGIRKIDARTPGRIHLRKYAASFTVCFKKYDIILLGEELM